MSQTEPSEVKFEGEDANSGFASPALDLFATTILVAIALAMMVASWRLPMPGAVHTAPGLLPFLIASSLLLMALGLGASALARRRSGRHIPAFADRDVRTDIRSLILAVAVAIYIAALQFLAFQHNVSIFGTNLRLTAFEPATIVALCSIIHVSWRGPIWITVLISVAWTVVLSMVFQLVFRIPLPGSF